MPHIEWGLLIVNYLFLGGLSAGLYFVSALATYLQQREPNGLEPVARYGALLAPWPVALGSGLLIFDLGNWNRFYLLFLHFRWQSPMSIGSWLLLFFNGIAFLNAWAWLKAPEREWIKSRLRLPEKYAPDLSHWRAWLAAAGFPLSVCVAIYTGVLLGAVQARPFWNTNLVAQMFLFSAFSTGSALLIVILTLRKNPVPAAPLRMLYTLDIGLILLEFFIVLPYVIHGELSALAVRQALDLILGGPYTLAFWLLFAGLGLLTPLALEIFEVAPAMLGAATLHLNRRLAVAAGLLVIFGGYVLRYVFVYAGQASTFR